MQDSVRHPGKDIVLVTGSTAIDQTGIYPDSFETYQHQYRIEAFNASFQLADIKTSFGGCAVNIVYGLHLLGIKAKPLSSAGRNFRDRYLPRLNQLGIDVSHIAIDDTREHSASCMILNDAHGNQIIGFYPGPAVPGRQLPSALAIIDQVALAVLAPEAAQLMLKQAQDLAPLKIPIILDPGQVISDFKRDEILALLELSTCLIANEYEYRVLQTNGGIDHQDVLAAISHLVITRADQGVSIYRDGQQYQVDAVADVDIVDVTGCGDAFRAGYVYGMVENLGPIACGQLGCVMAALNLTTPATQNYEADVATVKKLQSEYYPAALRP